MTQKMEKALNEQINAEMYSAYLYLSMAAYFEQKNLKGFANWMHVQFKEEWAHAMRFFKFIIERGGKVELMPIEKPKSDWKDVIEVFEDTLKHEQHVTNRIHNLLSMAIEEKDFPAQNMLQWFVAEQVEEEASATEILEKLKMFDGKGPALFMMDAEMAKRQFVDPNADLEE